MSDTNSTTVLGNEAQDRIAHFLKRRQLNETMISLLKEVKDQRELKKGEVTTAQNATYDAIIESVSKSLREGWITTERVTQILDGAEVAGRQHICLFRIPDEQFAAVEASLQAPETLNTSGIQLDEFWEIPLGMYTRLMQNDNEFLVVKVTAPRFYWIEDEKRPTEDRIEIVKQRERERSAVIIKLEKTKKLLQFRVPIREKAPNADTGNSVYQFIVEIVRSQFGDAGDAWFNKLRPFPLSDAFQKIIENRDDFELYTDTPENQHFKSSMSHKGAAADAKDIRDFAQWGFAEGFARTSIRGAWKREDSDVQVRMHSEKIKTGQQMTRGIARLFFSQPCSDQEVEHVIRRISEHLA